MTPDESFMWAWWARWLSVGASIEWYRAIRTDLPQPSRATRRRLLAAITRELIELDRLCDIRPTLSV